jgi:uncharacterized protein (TIGR00369 family)
MKAPPSRSDEEVLRTFSQAQEKSHSSKTLDFKMLEVDQAEGSLVVSFTGREEWTNPIGSLQGGFLTAMLDETMTVAGIVAADFKKTMPTLEIKVSFLRPAQPGSFKAIGRAIRMGRTVAFLEAELYGPDGKMVAKASATASPQPISRSAK